MRIRPQFLLGLFGALAVLHPAMAEETRTNELLDALRSAPETGWEQVEAELLAEWSLSGSPAMNLLLDRGRTALEDDQPGFAIEHLTALVENAPDFAEGWNARATAFFQAGLLGPAVSDIGRTLALQPNHFGALTGLGLIMEETGDMRGAKRAYEAALAIHPRRPDLREAVERLEAELQGKDI